MKIKTSPLKTERCSMLYYGLETTVGSLHSALAATGCLSFRWRRGGWLPLWFFVAIAILSASPSSILEAQEVDSFDSLFDPPPEKPAEKQKKSASAKRKQSRRVEISLAAWDSGNRSDDKEGSASETVTQGHMDRMSELAERGETALERETARLQLIEWEYQSEFETPAFETPRPRVNTISYEELDELEDTPGSSSNRIGETPQSSDSLVEPVFSEGVRFFDEYQFPEVQRGDTNLFGEDPPAEQPEVLRPPVPREPRADEFDPRYSEAPPKVPTYFDPPLGFTGPSSILPSESQQNEHFVPIEDRWRTGFPEWDRYGNGNPRMDDQPYERGHWWDPYNQNVLKGDFPIIGQHTFFNITATEQMLNEYRQVPTGTTPFESTVNPGQNEFFGRPDQYFFQNNLKLQMSLTHGDTAFKPFDWQVRVTPVFNMNYLSVKELGVVSPDVRAGTTRFRTDVALEEWFVEAKLADLSPDYDFLSVRAGSQPFVSDFRGFIFADTNRAVRLFGTRLANRDQFNLIFVDQTEKETNSGLNTFNDRNQTTLIANYFRQDFIFPGYTSQLSFHYNNDGPSTEFDRNNFLVRPDPAGSYQPHRVEAYYMGWAGDGHIGRVNVSHAFYHVEGRDSFNPIQGQESHIRANMAAAELSYDRDWVRFRTSYFWASGDDNPNDCYAEGFDTILDNPNFAGGQFSYWQRQSIRLFGVNLVQRDSLVPNLRSSKTQGQSNFVNPGLHLVNAGMDFEITPKVKAITNVNLLWFDTTESLERFAFQNNIRRRIGTDLSLGLEYRPRLSDNIIVAGGVSSLIPGKGFDDLFGVTDPISVNSTGPGKADTLHALFLDLVFTY
jgi:hypothetical protein